MASTASLSPFTTLTTPSGTPASLAISAIRSGHDGSFSEGLSTKVLPQAIAIGNIQSGIIAGKLNGVIPAHTPSGWRNDRRSTPVPTFSLNSPFKRLGMPQANSTTSMPRATEPLASASVLPCSELTRSASSSMCCSSRSLSLNMIRARRSGVIAAHLGKASLAALTAASISAALAKATRPDFSPTDGLKMSP